MTLLDRLGLTRPVFLAPMAGISTPALAAAVSDAGGLGSLGLGALDADAGRKVIAETRALTARPFNVNLFCHRPEPPDPARDAVWIERLRPEFARFNAAPPERLREIYRSLQGSADLSRMLRETRPAVVSFHFGLPDAALIADLKAVGAVLLASATNLAEGRAILDAGLDAIVAQGWQAGGHRGMFDPDAPDQRLSTLDLLQELAPLGLPLIAAGGIMTVADVRAVVQAGAIAAQCGTAYLRAPEAATDPAHREALATGQTVMTRAISGRPARSLANLFTALGDERAAGYPYAYDAGKALNAAARAAGETGFGAQWAGTGAAQAQALPAAEITRLLAP